MASPIPIDHVFDSRTSEDNVPDVLEQECNKGRESDESRTLEPKDNDSKPQAPEPERAKRDVEPSPTHSTLSQQLQDLPKQSSDSREARALSVLVSAPARPWEYQPLQGATTVGKVVENIQGPAGSTWYRIEYENDTEDTVSRILFFFYYFFFCCFCCFCCFCFCFFCFCYFCYFFYFFCCCFLCKSHKLAPPKHDPIRRLL